MLDIPLKHDGTGWVLGDCFQYHYRCVYPLTRQEHEFFEKYVRPTVENILEVIIETDTPELRKQYAEGVLRNSVNYEWFL